MGQKGPGQRAGLPGALLLYDSWDIPREFEKTVPQVFPTTAPGSFTQLEGGQIVMTSFYPYQWDLNYANPVVFNDMTENLLFLANRGIDVIRLDAIPYIWKELGTNCRNLPQVHTLARMLRMVCEIVCPGVLLLGEVVMEPAKVAPYFGTPEKPECHMLYNVTTMATTWHTLAAGDVSLLKRQMEAVRRAIEREKQEARREMRHEVERLALDIAGKVLRTDLSGDAGQVELVHRMMDELEDKEGGLR